jgi:hypothetical protein
MGLTQWQRFITAGVIPRPHPPLIFFRQVDKRAGGASELLQLRVNACQEFFGKAGSDSAGKQKRVRTLVADEQGVEVFPGAFGQGVGADHNS